MLRAFPARAGMNLEHVVDHLAEAGVPRSRGDEPTGTANTAISDARSPLARG